MTTQQTVEIDPLSCILNKPTPNGHFESFLTYYIHNDFYEKNMSEEVKSEDPIVDFEATNEESDYRDFVVRLEHSEPLNHDAFSEYIFGDFFLGFFINVFKDRVITVEESEIVLKAIKPVIKEK